MQYLIHCGVTTLIFFLCIMFMNHVMPKITKNEPQGGLKTDLSILLVMFCIIPSGIAFAYNLWQLIKYFIV